MSGNRRTGLLIGCIILAVVLVLFFSVSLTRYKHFCLGFDVPKDAVLKSYNPRTLTSDAKSALADVEPSFIFGQLTYRRVLLEEDVPVSALYVIVDRKELNTLGRTTARSYVLWHTANDGYIGNAIQPSIIKTYAPIDVILMKKDGKRWLLNVQCGEHDPLPISGVRWYELD